MTYEFTRMPTLSRRNRLSPHPNIRPLSLSVNEWYRYNSLLKLFTFIGIYHKNHFLFVLVLLKLGAYPSPQFVNTSEWKAPQLKSITNSLIIGLGNIKPFDPIHKNPLYYNLNNRIFRLLISFFSGFRLKIGKNEEMILGKFQTGSDLVKSTVEISMQKHY